jgi:hypothetical protein
MPAAPAGRPRSTSSRSAATPPAPAVAVKYQSWGFTSTDKLVGDDRRDQDFRALRDRAERISDGE